MVRPTVAAATAPRWSASAAEDRELCAIARDTIAEALVRGSAHCTFRGICVRAYCWNTTTGSVAHCTFDGEAVGLAESQTLRIIDLQLVREYFEAGARQAQYELQFVSGRGLLRKR